MNKPFVISDPIHRYLRVAAHERVVIDHPITQRLRRITQTGLAEFVFPEARTSRFVHSLGAMHLASRFVISALENATPADARLFVREIEKSLKNTYSCSESERQALLTEDEHNGTGGLAAVKAVFKVPELQNDPGFRGWLGLIEAAVRLAALFHDLGHLPFSHDFEYALKAYIQSNSPLPSSLEKLIEITKNAPHEAIGHRLADLVFTNIIETHANLPNGVRMAYYFAKRILDEEPDYGATKKPGVTALGWLHTLIDGEIDVDRADYLLRDGRALGLEFATYNLDQLVHNLILMHNSNLGYVTAVDDRGFNALESYCLTRARSNQVFIRHHKVAQLGAAFRYASTEALKSQPGQVFLKELAELVREDLPAGEAVALLNRFARYDDPWWIEVLRQQDSDKDPLFKASLDLILARQPTLKSVWKRRGHLSDLQRKEVNRFWESSREKLDETGNRIRRLQKKHSVLLVIHTFKPYAVLSDGDRSQMMVRTEKGLKSASELSPILQSLRKAWLDDVHVHAFTLKNSSKSTDQIIKEMTKGSSPSRLVRRVTPVSGKLKQSSSTGRRAASARRVRGVH